MIELLIRLMCKLLYINHNYDTVETRTENRKYNGYYDRYDNYIEEKIEKVIVETKICKFCKKRKMIITKMEELC